VILIADADEVLEHVERTRIEMDPVTQAKSGWRL
jgi:hypothetical protein